MGRDALIKFSLISDMHIDFPQEKTPYDKLEKNVIVAGDTANGLEGLKFLQKLRNKGFNVFACDGNHEHYANISKNRVAEETASRFRENHSSIGDMDGVPIILRNGWYLVTDENLWRGYMNDSTRCVLTKSEVNGRAYNDFNAIRLELQEWRDYQYKGIVVTHTAPCMETLNPDFYGHYSNEWYYNPYMRDLLAEFKDQIHVWCHGHTHRRNEATVEGVRVICNPRGYPGENPDWAPLTVEINT
jgi:predicted phosphodiesterase